MGEQRARHPLLLIRHTEVRAHLAAARTELRELSEARSDRGAQNHRAGERSGDAPR